MTLINKEYELIKEIMQSQTKLFQNKKKKLL